jgi:nickel transport protein
MKFRITILITSYLLLLTSPVYAHKVNIFAYVEGDTIYTESYFPDGRRVEGGRIEVYDSLGNMLLEGRTNRDGQFNFKPPKIDDLKIVLVASMGHKASYTLSKDELKSGSRKMEEDKGVSFFEIIAGIGYIFGIFGVILYFMSRKRG